MRCSTPSRTLERVRGLHKAGAGSVKDLEQAESDYAQAKAEFSRAEARLKEIGVPVTAQRRVTPLDTYCAN